MNLSGFEQAFSGRVRVNESMENWSTFRCKSICTAIASPRDKSELVSMLQVLNAQRIEWKVLGRGSNLLVRDGGYRGVLLDLSQALHRIEVVEEKNEWVRVCAQAGVPNGTLLSWMRDRNWKGFGFSFGIPGSIGGGIRMNAGTPSGWFSQILDTVEGITPDGKNYVWNVTEADFSYRDFPKGRDTLILSGTFRFLKSTAREVEAEIEVAKEKRRNQPLDLPNFGSVFRNPPNDFAGRLIEKSGLKGTRIGGAKISEKHANFIVNIGGGKTSDVVALMEMAKSQVFEKFGVVLEPEIHMIGEEP